MSKFGSPKIQGTGSPSSSGSGSSRHASSPKTAPVFGSSAQRFFQHEKVAVGSKNPHSPSHSGSPGLHPTSDSSHQTGTYRLAANSSGPREKPTSRMSPPLGFGSSQPRSVTPTSSASQSPASRGMSPSSRGTSPAMAGNHPARRGGNHMSAMAGSLAMEQLSLASCPAGRSRALASRSLKNPVLGQVAGAERNEETEGATQAGHAESVYPIQGAYSEGDRRGQRPSSRGRAAVAVAVAGRKTGGGVAGRESRHGAGPEARGSTDTRLDLQSKRIRSLAADTVPLNGRAEYVYLRGNLLTSLEGVEVLKRVKVLDLSFNAIQDEALSALSGCKALQQLFLASNQLTSLACLPTLPHLEFLSASQNHLTSCAMEMQPKLKVLTLSSNNIGSFHFFPFLPALEHLRLDDNPVSDLPSARLAALTVSISSLLTFNETPYDEQERQFVSNSMPTGLSSMCIRLGWMVPEQVTGREDESVQLEASLQQHLASLWSERLPPTHEIKSVALDTPVEDKPCRCSLVIGQKDDLSEESTQGGERGALFQSHGGAGQGEGEHGEREEGEVEGEEEEEEGEAREGEGDRSEVSALTHEQSNGGLAAGTVSLHPVLSERERRLAGVGGKDRRDGGKEGCASASASASASVVKYEWFKSCKGTREFVRIGDASGEVYTPVYADLHAVLKVVCTPVINGREGQPIELLTSPVAPGPGVPRTLHLSVKGEAREGSCLAAHTEVSWSSGAPGKCNYIWRRVNEENESQVVASGSSEYMPSLRDVGCTIELEFVPVSVKGLVGQAQRAASAVVAPAPPEARDVHIEGEAIVEQTLTGYACYFGGYEGDSSAAWFRCKSNTTAATTSGERDGGDVDGGDVLGRSSSSGGDSEADRVRVGEGWQYTVTAEDAGHILLFQFIPVSSTGLVGAPGTAVTSQVRLPPPTITDLRITGDMMEGEEVTVEGEFVWGEEGDSVIDWYFTAHPEAIALSDFHEIECEPRNSRGLIVPVDAVGCYLAVRYTPVREDGDKGKPVVAISQDTVQVSDPQVLSIDMDGEEEEGGVLVGYYSYKGGHEGESLLQWFRYADEGGQPGIEGAIVEPLEAREGEEAGGPEMTGGGMSRYVITRKDVGSFLSFRVTPVRGDGVEGEPQAVCTAGPVMAGPPTAHKVWLGGEPQEGESLHAYWSYTGGREGRSRVQWLSVAPDGSDKRFISIPVSLEGREGEGEGEEEEGERRRGDASLRLSASELGRMVVVMVTPVRSDGEEGESVESKAVGPITAAPPACVTLDIIGNAIEESTLTYTAQYANVTGVSRPRCMWQRIRPSKKEEVLTTEDHYTLTLSDVGCHIRLTLTPIRSDGVEGESVFATTAAVLPGFPTAVSLTLTDQAVEGVVVNPRCDYKGGQEGSSQWEWFCLPKSHLAGPTADVSSLKCLGRERTFTPYVNEVGHHLAVRWTPVRADGTIGQSVVATSSYEVLPGDPIVSDVHMMVTDDGVLQGVGTYCGGDEGDSQFSWYRQRVKSADDMAGSGQLEPIEFATSAVYEPDESDYGCRLVFGYLPRRSDGLAGSLVLSDPGPIILPELSDEEALSVEVVGDAKELNTLRAAYLLSPTLESCVHSMQLKWWRAVSGSAAHEEIAGATGDELKLTSADVGYFVLCSASLEDNFGRVFNSVATTAAPVMSGEPKLLGLSITGGPYHTSTFTVSTVYDGGKGGEYRVQWYRVPPGSVHNNNPTPIPGATSLSYIPDVDDATHRLMVQYTPIRSDGSDAAPVRAFSPIVEIDPEIVRDVNVIIDHGATKFETNDVSRTGKPERRVIEITRNGLRVSRTKLLGREVVELKASYDAPFRVDTFRDEPQRVRILMTSDSELDLTLPSQRARDIVTLALRAFVRMRRELHHLAG